MINSKNPLRLLLAAALLASLAGLGQAKNARLDCKVACKHVRQEAQKACMKKPSDKEQQACIQEIKKTQNACNAACPK